MNGKERYYQREEELSKIGYYAVLFMRHFLQENPTRAKELCEKLVKENAGKHGHEEQTESIVALIDENLLKMATKRFAYRSFDAPVYWAKKHAEEKRKKLYQPKPTKRFIVKIKK